MRTPTPGLPTPSPAPRRRALVWLALVPLHAACASSPGAAAVDEPVTAPGPTAPSEPVAAAPEPPAKPDPGVPVDRELTPSDCKALGSKYGALTRSDEMAKLSPKLSDAQRESARGAFDKAAQILEGRWVESCTSSLVGKVASEEALRCGMAAKTVAAFDVCLNGPAAPAPAP